MPSTTYTKCLALTEQYKNEYKPGSEKQFIGSPSLLAELKNFYLELNSDEKTEYQKFIKSMLIFGPESKKDVRNAAVSGIIGAVVAPASVAYYAGKVVMSSLIAYGFFGGVAGFLIGPEIVGRNLTTEKMAVIKPYLTISNALGFGVGAISTMRSYAAEQAAVNMAALPEDLKESVPLTLRKRS